MSLVKDSEDLPVEVDLVELKQELSKNGLVICPVHGCSEDFKSLWGLKYHLKQNNHHTASEGKFKCEQCNLLFQSRVTLRQHRIVEHSGSEGGSPLSSPRQVTCSYNPGQKSWDTFAKTAQIGASPLHPQCNVDLKGPSHPESLQVLSTLLGVGGGRAVTKTV